jgi:DNA polymerase-1
MEPKRLLAKLRRDLLTLTHCDKIDGRKVLIIDGYNMIHRCRFQWGGGMAAGEYQIVYNFFRTLRALIEEFSPDLVYFPLDGRPTKRLEMYEEYKGNRRIETEDPDEIAYWESFRMQKKIIIESLKNDYPIITVYHTDHECDDIVLYLIEEYHLNDETVIASSDTDFIQILNNYSDKVKLYNPVARVYRDNTEYDYVAWKAMVGDRSDNIPGVRGIGKKTATKILVTDGELDRMLEDPLFKKSFKESYNLIKLLDLTSDEEELVFTKAKLNCNNIKDDFSSMGFKSMIDEKYLNNYFNTFQNLS